MSTTSIPDPPGTANPSKTAKSITKLTLWPLVAATFFMVCGGAYGTEDIVHGAGYGRALLILALTPLVETARRLCLAWGLHCVTPADAHDLDDVVGRASDDRV